MHVMIDRHFLFNRQKLKNLRTKTALGKEVRPVTSKHKNLFVLKADKEYAGAIVEVFYSNGDLITSQKLEKKKMIIDFRDAKFGTYTIRVVKDNKKQEFYYEKK